MKILAALLLIVIAIYTQHQNQTQIQHEHNVIKINRILIHKSERTMEVYHGDKLLKCYRIALGFNPIGPKEEEKDGKTPEGQYHICAKNPRSRFHLSLKISYPSPKDLEKANLKGKPPGGDIMIHGLGKTYEGLAAVHYLRDWTLGCVAVTNTEIEEIYQAVDIGTPVEIRP